MKNARKTTTKVVPGIKLKYILISKKQLQQQQQYTTLKKKDTSLYPNREVKQEMGKNILYILSTRLIEKPNKEKQ